jgi:hypothetical protein
MHDECGGDCGDGHLSDAELEQWSVGSGQWSVKSAGVLLRHILSARILNEESNVMSEAINPEAAQPSTTQAFEQSDRNPQVTSWSGTDAEGGQLPAPASSESGVTQAN